MEVLYLSILVMRYCIKFLIKFTVIGPSIIYFTHVEIVIRVLEIKVRMNLYNTCNLKGIDQ